jgi:hypothetical protein
LCPQRHQRGSGRWWATCCCDGGVWRCWERAGGRALVLDDSRQRLRACQPVSALHRRWLGRRSQWPSHIPAHASVRQRASSLYLAVACAKPRRCSCSRDGSWGRDEMAGLRSLPEQRSRRPSPLARLYPGSLLLTLWRDARPALALALALALAALSTAERAPAPWARQPKMPLNALISPNLLAIGALMCFMRAACILAS